MKMKLLLITPLVLVLTIFEEAKAFNVGRNRRKVQSFNFSPFSHGNAYVSSQQSLFQLEPINKQVVTQYDQVIDNDYDQIQDYSDSSRSVAALQVVDDVFSAIKECVTDKLEQESQENLMETLLEALLEQGDDDPSDDLYDQIQPRDFTISSAALYSGRSGESDPHEFHTWNYFMFTEGRANKELIGPVEFNDVNSNILGLQLNNAFNGNTNNVGTFAPTSNTHQQTTTRQKEDKESNDNFVNKLHLLENKKRLDSNIQVLSIGAQDSLTGNHKNGKDVNFLVGRSFETHEPQNPSDNKYDLEAEQTTATIYDNTTPEQSY